MDLILGLTACSAEQSKQLHNFKTDRLRNSKKARVAAIASVASSLICGQNLASLWNNEFMTKAI